MFTGLIEEVGEVVGIAALAEGLRISFRAPTATEGLAPGDSIAIDGVCLTALNISGQVFDADVSPESLARTNLSRCTVGTAVNLERPLAVGQRLGGHFVQGHVDAVSKLVRSVQEGEFLRLTFTIPEGLRPLLVEKGSVALNGVSLTVAGLDSDTFDVALVPHTLERTNLGNVGNGGALNMEVDILGKYVAQLLRASLPSINATNPSIGRGDGVDLFADGPMDRPGAGGAAERS